MLPKITILKPKALAVNLEDLSALLMKEAWGGKKRGTMARGIWDQGFVEEQGTEGSQGAGSGAEPLQVDL